MRKFRTPRHSFYSRCWLFPTARPGETLLPRQIIPLGAGAAWIIQALSAHQPVRPRALPDQELHCSQGWTQQSQPRHSLHQDWVFDQDSRQSLSNRADRFLRHFISFHQLPRSRATQFPWLSARRTRWRSRDLPACHFRTFHEQERCHGRSQQAETCWLTTLSCQCRWKTGTLSLKIQHWSSSAITTGRSRRMWNRVFLPAKQVPFYTLTSILSWTRENLSITALRGLYVHLCLKTNHHLETALLLQNACTLANNGDVTSASAELLPLPKPQSFAFCPIRQKAQTQTQPHCIFHHSGNRARC